MNNIRNFCIIAHIDHGKSTLADRFLELTNTVEKRKMREQVLDMMDLERERGITIKLQPVRMEYKVTSNKYEVTSKGQADQANSLLHTSYFILNLIDTPGHIDFNYEVSRSLAAVEGAILLVDATQGVQAQTIGNLYLALEQNLTIIPVINKIDLPNAQIERTRAEIVHLLGCGPEEIFLVSAKTGEGVGELLEVVVKKIPPPHNFQFPISNFQFLRALVFDSKYDEYRGVVAYVRIFDGEVKAGEKISFMAQKIETEVLEVGYFKPDFLPAEKLAVGEIGYIVTGLKDVSGCRVGDTIASLKCKIKNEKLKIMEDKIEDEIQPLPGYKEVKPMVFAGIFPKEGVDFGKLREAIEKLKLNDAALFFEPERSSALGFGLRCGFLGLLHLEIIKERLRREYGLELVVTTPSVAYKVKEKSGGDKIIRSAGELPEPLRIEKIEEPWVKIDILTPNNYLGSIMQLVLEKRGIYKNTEYLIAPYLSSPQWGEGGSLLSRKEGWGEGETRVILHYEMPLSAILTDFYDKLKSVSAGYASLNYELLDYRPAEIVRLDILVAEEKIEALSTLVIKDEAYRVGRQIVETLKKTIPRQMFEVKIQAALGGTIIAAERLPAMRKDVLAKMSGGDVTRKMKLLQKQKKGKKSLKAGGHVDIPAEAYLAVLKR